MKRRNFLASTLGLLCLPFIGKAKAKPLPQFGWQCQGRHTNRYRAFFTFTPAREEICEHRGRLYSMQVGSHHTIDMELEERDGNKYTYRTRVAVEDWAKTEKDYREMLEKVCFNPTKYFKMADSPDLGTKWMNFTFGLINMGLVGFVKKSGESMWSIGSMTVSNMGEL